MFCSVCPSFNTTFKFAKEYNHDLDSRIQADDAISNTNEPASKRKRGWLFSKKEKERNNYEEDEKHRDNEVKKEPDDKNENVYIHIRVPYEVVYALWVNIIKGLGLVSIHQDDIDIMTSIINYVQESLVELGLLDVESGIDHQCTVMNDSESELTSLDIKNRRYPNLSVRHAINEEYDFFMYQSEPDVKEKIFL